MPAYRPHPDGIQLDLRVTPRASRAAVGGLHGERLIVRVNAPPVDGAANDAVRAALAEALGVGRAAVTLVRGETARDKTVAIAGDPAALLDRARELCGVGGVGSDGDGKGATPPAKSKHPKSK